MSPTGPQNPHQLASHIPSEASSNYDGQIPIRLTQVYYSISDYVSFLHLLGFSPLFLRHRKSLIRKSEDSCRYPASWKLATKGRPEPRKPIHQGTKYHQYNNKNNIGLMPTVNDGVISSTSGLASIEKPCHNEYFLTAEANSLRTRQAAAPHEKKTCSHRQKILDSHTDNCIAIINTLLDTCTLLSSNFLTAKKCKSQQFIVS